VAEAASARTRRALELFAPLGPTYERYARVLSLGQDPRWRRFLVSRVEAGPGDEVLDVATGTGAVARELLRQKGCAVVGVDQSPEMLAVAREHLPTTVKLVEASAERLPFGDDSFTCAAMMQVFFFLPDAEAVLAECRRVLRPGGRLAVFTISELARGTPAAPEPMASRSRFYTEDELVRLARAAGFADASVEHPDLEPHARAAGLPDDVVKLFAGDPVGGQLLVAE
jgi:ubiquinone/menaquinone biosynthesis C-methylase UbiE